MSLCATWHSNKKAMWLTPAATPDIQTVLLLLSCFLHHHLSFLLLSFFFFLHHLFYFICCLSESRIHSLSLHLDVQCSKNLPTWLDLDTFPSLGSIQVSVTVSQCACKNRGCTNKDQSLKGATFKGAAFYKVQPFSHSCKYALYFKRSWQETENVTWQEVRLDGSMVYPSKRSCVLCALWVST